MKISYNATPTHLLLFPPGSTLTLQPLHPPPSQKKKKRGKRKKDKEKPSPIRVDHKYSVAHSWTPSAQSHQKPSTVKCCSIFITSFNAPLQLFPILTFLEGCIREAFSDFFLVMNLHSLIPLQRSFLAHRSEWQHGSRTFTWFPVVHWSWISTWFPVHPWKFRLTSKSVQHS